MSVPETTITPDADSTPTVRDLLDDVDLGLTVIVAEPDALDRRVNSAYITDLPDPSRFLSAGDVVLTSAQWIWREGGTQSFVSALARCEVSAVIIGIIDIGRIPSEVIELCRQAKLTLLLISPTVSFKDVSDMIVHSQEAATSQGAEFVAVAARAVSRGAGVAELVNLLAESTGVHGWVVDGVGVLVAHSGVAPSPEVVAQAWNGMERARFGRVDRVDGVDAARHFTALRIGEDTRTGFVAFSGPDVEGATSRSGAVDGLIGSLRVAMELSARWRATTNAQAADMFISIRDGAVPPGAVSAWLRTQGIDPQSPLVVATARVDDPAFPEDAVVAMLERALTSRGRRTVGGHAEGTTVVIAAGEERDDLVPLAEQLLADNRLLLDRRRLNVGMSDTVSGIGLLGPGMASAMERLEKGDGEGQVQVTTALHVQNHRELLRLLGEPTRRGYAHEVLDPLLDYDRRHHAELVTTLRAFLDGGGAWRETAASLHLHPNTLRYRIARIQDLLDRNMDDPAVRVDLFLALECLESVGE